MQTIEQTVSKKDLFYGALIFLVFISCYYPTFIWLHNKYRGLDSYYSHGYLIPIITVYLIYMKKEELKEVKLKNSLMGLYLVIFALSLHVISVLGDIHFLSGFSIIFYIAGCVMYLFGYELIKRIAYPLLFLIFMCPLPESFINIVALPAKSLATSLALYIIDFIGIPSIREGFRIQLKTSTFVVGTPCNGMRSLIAFLALGFLMTYIVKAKLWKKILLFTLIPPISIILNGVRIAILLIIANRYGQEAASTESYLHDGSGFLVFIIGFVFMLFFYKLGDDEQRH